jgi:hypothetical protein
MLPGNPVELRGNAKCCHGTLIASFESNYMIMIALIAGALTAGLGIVFVEVRNAPHGYEDGNGFHFVNRSAKPAPVSRRGGAAVNVGV